jgi:hypothetical protein
LVLQGWLSREYLEEVNPEDKLFWETSPLCTHPASKQKRKRDVDV